MKMKLKFILLFILLHGSCFAALKVRVQEVSKTESTIILNTGSLEKNKLDDIKFLADKESLQLIARIRCIKIFPTHSTWLNITKYQTVKKKEYMLLRSKTDISDIVIKDRKRKKQQMKFNKKRKKPYQEMFKNKEE